VIDVKEGVFFFFLDNEYFLVSKFELASIDKCYSTRNRSTNCYRNGRNCMLQATGQMFIPSWQAPARPSLERQLVQQPWPWGLQQAQARIDS